MTPNLDGPVGARPLVIKWRVTQHIMMIFEAPLEDLERITPAPLVPVEVKPGIGLVYLAALHFEDGHFGPDSVGFDEAVFVVAVAPDLSMEMPTPRFSFFAFNVYTDSPDFVAYEAKNIHTPAQVRPGFQVRFRDDGLGVEVRDDSGPIAVMNNTHPAPSFRRKEMWGQHFNDTRGGVLHSGPWHWEGALFEHEHQGDWGRLYPHSIFAGLDVSRLRRCSRQFFARPGEEILERFYEVRTADLD